LIQSGSTKRLREHLISEEHIARIDYLIKNMKAEEIKVDQITKNVS
jgi:hypothetical protein